MNRFLSFSILTLLLIAPASAAPVSNGSTVKSDPNRRICQEVGTIGTRLGKKKICATAAEWEDMRRQDREAVEQGQRSARIGCSIAPSALHSGAPSC